MNENVIEWITGDDVVAVALHQKKYINRVKRMALLQPENVKILRENPDGSIFAHLPLSALKLTLKTLKNLNEQQKLEQIERMRRARAQRRR